jgi:hypothetical protein
MESWLSEFDTRQGQTVSLIVKVQTMSASGQCSYSWLLDSSAGTYLQCRYLNYVEL